MNFAWITAAAASGAWKAFMDSDAMGQGIVIVQLVMSVIIWGVILARRQHLNDMERRTNSFVKAFANESDVLNLYLNRRRNQGSAMEVIYEKTCERMVDLIPSEQRLALQNNPDAIRLSRSRMNLVETTSEHNLQEQIVKLRKGMGWLAIGSSTAPLLGLFGTVWGVMLAFQAMALKGTALISELAPGISSALLTTVVGLIVAIPSTIFYNMLNDRVNKQIVQLEGFTDELTGQIALRYQAGES